jgi:hypothetical protein
MHTLSWFWVNQSVPLFNPPFRKKCLYQVRVITFSQFSGCWLLLSVYILMSFDIPFVRLFGVRYFCYYPYFLILCAYRRRSKYQLYCLVLTPTIYPTQNEHDNHYIMWVNTLWLILLGKLMLVLSDRLNDIFCSLSDN